MTQRYDKRPRTGRRSNLPGEVRDDVYRWLTWGFAGLMLVCACLLMYRFCG